MSSNLFLKGLTLIHPLISCSSEPEASREPVGITSTSRLASPTIVGEARSKKKRRFPMKSGGGFGLMILLTLFQFGSSAVADFEMVRGMNLSDDTHFPYDANLTGEKTDAQIAVDRIKELGANHVVLNPIWIMRSPWSVEIEPKVSELDYQLEFDRYSRLTTYIHSLGMTVGIRPIFFVVKEDGTDYIEETPTGEKIWWHGNIQPKDPYLWFESFRNFLDTYIEIANANHVEEFTLGAELYSLTVGIEDQWKEHPFGFPNRWIELLHYVRRQLGLGTRLMYDVNFTDDTITPEDELPQSGGELARWKYRIVDLAHPKDKAEMETWRDLIDFWSKLDAIGIDMYRNLSNRSEDIPEDYDQLVKVLSRRANAYRRQLTTLLSAIDRTVAEAIGNPQFKTKIIFKEIGYPSVELGFIDPFRRINPTEEVNQLHQAASYEAFFQAFWQLDTPWFRGVSFWDVGVDPSRNEPDDPRHSPLGKQAEQVIRHYFQR